MVRRYNFPPLKIKSRCENRLQTLSTDDDKEGILVEERKKYRRKKNEMKKKERERERERGSPRHRVIYTHSGGKDERK